jgi:thiosulfate dehydrogenase
MRTVWQTTLLAIVLTGGVYFSWRQLSPASQVAHADSWMTRTITACDKRKTVVVEGVSPEEPLPPAKARQVATLLQDLMRFCTEEVKARLTTQEEIFLSVNGLPYQRYVLGSELPFLPVHGGKPHSQREMQMWDAAFKKVVDEGKKLFHDSSLGKNGISCDMCHPDASNTHPETYPKFQTQLKAIALLRDMINWCIENPLEGEKLAENDPKMKALEAYILDQRKGVALAAGKH